MDQSAKPDTANGLQQRGNMSISASKWSFATTALWSMLAVFGVSRISGALADVVGSLTLLWPISGLAMGLAYYWGRPALVGIFCGSLLYILSSDWQWFSLVQLFSASSHPFANFGAALAICAASVGQSWLCALILRRRMPAILEGTLRTPSWLVLLFLVGPLGCLIKSGVAALVFGWWSLPFQLDKSVFWFAMWLSNTASTMMVLAVIVIRELRLDAPELSRNPLRSPWLTLAFVAVPTWLLAGYANYQQVAQEQVRFGNQSDQLRGDMQAGIDAAEQKLRVLRAFYRSNADLSPAEFNQFANELLEHTPLLLGLGLVARVPDSERAMAEGRLRRSDVQVPNLTEIGRAGRLVAARRRADYWPLIQIAPEARANLLGFDVASEPAGHQALLEAQDDQLSVSVRSASEPAVAEAIPTVFLYLGTAKPERGAVIAPLKIDALLTGSNIAQDLLALHHGLTLTDARGSVVASIGGQRDAQAEKNSSFNRSLGLRVGEDSWGLHISTARIALPYLSAPLWWFGQLLPQLLCIAVGLLLAMATSNEKKILRLERQYVGYLENREADHPRTQEKPFDVQIEQAWQDKAFVSRFEPIVDLRSGQIRGVEALLRWDGAPEGVTTADIIEWAERKNLIGELGKKSLGASLEAFAAWPMPRLLPFTISVNISATELQNPFCAERILQALNRAKIPGRRLCVEITEGILIRSDRRLITHQLGMLRAAGVRIALDDFGAGYSSMGYLRQLPVDRIKLDSLFVAGLTTDIKARQIVASIVALGSTLGIDLVAEGVEDAATADVLSRLGCTLAQGWLFSKAVNAQVIRRWIVDGTILYTGSSEREQFAPTI
jgi:EAL domain-containing protein (putative c-di-GMP-specific phosphodiesterase class I)